MKTDKKYWVALNACLELGAVKLRRLYNYFPSMKSAWEAGERDLLNAGLNGDAIAALYKARAKIDPCAEMEKLCRMKIGVVTIADDNFPKNLLDIPNPPAIIYIRGKLKKEDENAIGVVGTRSMTIYGRQVTEKIATGLALAGVTIVSGLARGVDTVAHGSSIGSGGRTIAILGCGIDDASIYPFENLALAQKIIEGHGAVISEFHIGTPALRHHFPMRNRIIAGLSLGIVVTECPERSGALLTARAAIEQGREVLSVPGDIRSQYSKGTNNLIKLGAKAVTGAEEILDEFGFENRKKGAIRGKIIPETPEEKLILACLGEMPKSQDLIIKKTKLGPSAVSSTLTMMEIQGKVRNVGMNQYVLKK